MKELDNNEAPGNLPRQLVAHRARSTLRCAGAACHSIWLS